MKVLDYYMADGLYVEFDQVEATLYQHAVGTILLRSNKSISISNKGSFSIFFDKFKEWKESEVYREREEKLKNV